MKFQRFLIPLCAALSLLVAQSTQAVTTVKYLDGVTGLSAANPNLTPTAPSHANSTDYSNAGLDLGNDGFIFFNWDAASPTQGVYPAADTVSQNVNNQLPGWLQLDFDPTSPTYSFGDDPLEEAFAKGGDATWDTLTLPDGTSGLSGALVDPRADNNTNNTINTIFASIGTPSSFWLHIVTDNTDGDHDPAGGGGRLRLREDADGGSARLNGLLPGLNGTADVWSFLYEDVQVGDILKVQLNSGVAGVEPSIAGFMIDVAIPEPSSLLLAALGVCGIGLGRRRRL